MKPQINVPGHEYDRHRVFIWRGAEFDESETESAVTSVHEFVQRVMEQYWNCKQPENQFNIEIIEEFSGRESEEFNDFF